MSRYLKLVLYLIVCINFMSCVFYVTACPPTLITDAVLVPLESGHSCIANSWPGELLPMDPPIYSMYLSSVYFAVNTFMTVGFGEFHARTYAEVRIVSYCRRSH